MSFPLDIIMLECNLLLLLQKQLLLLLLQLQQQLLLLLLLQQLLLLLLQLLLFLYDFLMFLSECLRILFLTQEPSCSYVMALSGVCERDSARRMATFRTKAAHPDRFRMFVLSCDRPSRLLLGLSQGGKVSVYLGGISLSFIFRPAGPLAADASPLW